MGNLSGITGVDNLIQLGKKHKAEEQYLCEADKLADFINAHKTTQASLQQLIEQVERLAVLSAQVGEYTAAMSLWNQLGKVDETQFFFPTKYEKKEEYKGFILLVSHELSRTGAPVVLQDMAKVLQKEGYFVLMLSPLDGALREELCEAGIPVIVDRHLLFGRFQKEQEYDKWWPSDVFVELFPLSVFCTAVMHNAITRYEHRAQSILWWLHEGSASFEAFGHCLPLKLSDRVHVAFVCEYVKEQLEKIGVYYEGTILNYGVEDANIELKSSTNDKVVFVSVATIDQRKGQDVLVDAISLLPLKYLDKSEFWFVGRKHDETIYQSVFMAEKGYPNVTIWGELPREKVLKLYDECDCMVCSSRDDPLPVVLTEMMILNKPCICSDHTGTAHYIEDGKNGFVFESDNAQSLCDKIVYAIDHKEELSQIGKQGRKIYEDNLAMETFRDNLLELVESLKENQ